MNSASEWRDTTSIRGAENHQKLSFGMEKPEIDREDPVLEHAITYVLTKKYPPDLGKDQKRAVRKRAGTLVAENGEVFVVKQKRRVKVVQSVEEPSEENFESLPRRSHEEVTAVFLQLPLQRLLCLDSARP